MTVGQWQARLSIHLCNLNRIWNTDLLQSCKSSGASQLLASLFIHAQCTCYMMACHPPITSKQGNLFSFCKLLHCKTSVLIPRGTFSLTPEKSSHGWQMSPRRTREMECLVIQAIYKQFCNQCNKFIHSFIYTMLICGNTQFLSWTDHSDFKGHHSNLNGRTVRCYSIFTK